MPPPKTQSFLFLLILLTFLFLTISAQENKCTSPSYLSGSQNITINVNNQPRIFQLSIPWSEYDCGPNTYCVGPPQEPRPIVMNFHGCNNHFPIIAYHEEISKVEQKALDLGYYVVTPLGTWNSVEGNWGWNTQGIKCGQIEDNNGNILPNEFPFIDSMLDFFENELCVDLDRVYSIGFSTGAFLTNELACDETMSKKFRGFGTMAGSMGKLFFNECNEREGELLFDGIKRSMTQFHSRGDKTVPFDGNQIWKSQSDVSDLWVKRNGCTEDDIPITTYNTSETLCERRECKFGDVEICTMNEIDHCWVGGRSGGFKVCLSSDGDVDATSKLFDNWERLDSE